VTSVPIACCTQDGSCTSTLLINDRLRVARPESSKSPSGNSRCDVKEAKHQASLRDANYDWARARGLKPRLPSKNRYAIGGVSRVAAFRW